MHPRQVHVRVLVVNQHVLQSLAGGNEGSPKSGSVPVDKDLIVVEESLDSLLLGRLWFLGVMGIVGVFGGSLGGVDAATAEDGDIRGHPMGVFGKLIFVCALVEFVDDFGEAVVLPASKHLMLNYIDHHYNISSVIYYYF